MSVGHAGAHIAAQTLPSWRVLRVPGAGHDVLTRSPYGREVVAGLVNDPARYETGCVATTTPTSQTLR